MKNALTTFEIAKLCGVDITTVIHWIDTGKLAAYKTPGGHRRVHLHEFHRFLKEYNMPVPRGIGAEPGPVLIADDDPEMREFIRTIIEAHHSALAVEEAEDGFSAGKLLAEIQPSMIVLDVRLPGLDGCQVCRQIREDRRLKDCRILAISAYGGKMLQTIMESGADACLEKPFTAEEFRVQLDRLLPATV